MKQEYHRALEQICLSEEARARIISVLEQKERGLKRPRRRIGRLILVCAVLILLLLGTGAAVVSRVGVLELFFQGDTSQLEPFVQTGASAQDKNYRLTLDSSICDGDTLYVVITVEGLHEQAVENLKNNQVVADCYRAAWGREMPENLMEQGQGDISVFQFQMEAGNHMSSFGFEELPAPSETSRSWQLQLTLTGLEHPQTEPIGLRLGFMEESCVLQIPVDQMPQVVRVSIARELSVDWNGGEEVFVDHVEIGPTRFTYVGKYPDSVSSLAPPGVLPDERRPDPHQKADGTGAGDAGYPGTGKCIWKRAGRDRLYLSVCDGLDRNYICDSGDSRVFSKWRTAWRGADEGTAVSLFHRGGRGRRRVRGPLCRKHGRAVQEIGS